jgi:chemotaxis protein MotB
MKHRATHHGGAWKVAYADFITAMMALFLVLWLTAQDTRIKEAVERAFRNPFSAVNKESTGIIPNQNKDASSGQSKAQGNFQSVNAVEVEMLRHITEDLAKVLQGTDEDQKSVQIDLTSEGLRINIFDISHKPIFESNSDLFTGYGAWVFSTLAWEISRYQTFKIELEGHTEAGTETGHDGHGNWELSSERANAARRLLVQNGVLQGQFFKVSGFADTQPMPNVPASSEANRRVSVLLKLDSAGMQTGSAQTPNAHHS